MFRSHAGFNADIMDSIRRAGFSHPTLIQQISWPAALSGLDLIGIAETGSGKTLAYALPGITHLLAQPRGEPADGPIMLVLAPTRELASQIEQEIRKYCSRGIRVTCVFGGVPKGPQKRQLSYGVDILIGTPGRLMDMVSDKATSLKRVSYLVIDEADRLLDMGFERQLRAIISQIRKDRQTLMWSATWPREVQQLAADYMNSTAVRFNIGSLDSIANENVQQRFVFCSEMDKREELRHILKHHGSEGKIMVFTDKKITCDQVTEFLRTNGIAALGIHGDKKQQERDWVMDQFKTGRQPILIATDVCARGIGL